MSYRIVDSTKQKVALPKWNRDVKRSNRTMNRTADLIFKSVYLLREIYEYVVYDVYLISCSIRFTARKERKKKKKITRSSYNV